MVPQMSVVQIKFIIKAASSDERALAVHARHGMLPSGLAHATPYAVEVVPL